jgi:hypothetical protein
MSDESAYSAATEAKFLKFCEEHPELSEKLGLWMADASILAITDPEAAELFEREFPELKG